MVKAFMRARGIDETVVYDDGNFYFGITLSG